MKFRLALAALAFALSACGGFSPPPAVQTPFARERRHTASGKIKHVVIIVQENRSFNNLFYGFPGAKTQGYGYDSHGNKITLGQIPLEISWDLDHSSTSYFAACNGTGSIPGTNCRMNGFNLERVFCNRSCPPNPPYAYVPRAETKPYFAIGKQYVLADEMYASNFDASSFVSHQYIIAGQAQASVNYPYGDWGCPGGSGDQIPEVGPNRQIPYAREEACYTDTTLGQEADDAGVSWAFYAGPINGDGGIWSAYQANKYVYFGSDWQNDVISPQTNFFNDVKNGNLRQISWVTPTCQNSDHAGCRSKSGPSWVASLVNAIGQSQYWDSTAIFIFWDDYGGWYDSEPPAYVDYDGLGIRIPMLIVSAYAKKHHVSHVQYEHGSILRFVEDQFGLPRLAASDTRATSPEKDCFDFTKPPRKFKTIPSLYGKEYFMHQPVDRRVPDWN
ncbi:MAG TPA: alkaline phosphatase family protein [Candidatus Nitrosotalea sp.]|nr:alkaline phosphatase family protein [Candidatus Nitrosotalea sp.]